MCGHIQATLCHIHGLGDPQLTRHPKTNRDNIHSNPKADGTTQTPHEVPMQIGKLSDGSKWRILGVLPPHFKPTTRATWQHSYGNEIGRLAQGMPGHNTSMNTIIFIKKNQVPQNRAKDVTYGLITCLIRPAKIEEPN